MCHQNTSALLFCTVLQFCQSNVPSWTAKCMPHFIFTFALFLSTHFFIRLEPVLTVLMAVPPKQLYYWKCRKMLKLLLHLETSSMLWNFWQFYFSSFLPHSIMLRLPISVIECISRKYGHLLRICPLFFSAAHILHYLLYFTNFVLQKGIYI